MTRRSKTNEADEAESSRALAFTVEPPSASTRTLQVISSESRARLAAVFEEMRGVLEGSDLDDVEGELLVWSM